MRYRYADPDDKPALVCPECKQKWDCEYGIVLLLSIGERPVQFDTTLDAEGWLVDVDRLVASGYHSITLCGGCNAQLCDMDDVVEHHEDNPW
jgi:hypothetical protein